MTKSSANAFLFERPFGSASDTILAGWWNAASTFASAERGLWRTAEFAREVSYAFQGLNSLPTQDDPHLTDGINDTLRTVRGKRERKPAFSRPYMLLLSQFEEVSVGRSGRVSSRQKADRHNRPKEYLYSPYYLLRQILTSPEFLASDAYAHAVLRAEIFSDSITFADKVARKRRSKGSVLDRVRGFIEFENVSRSLQKAEAYRRRGDTFYVADPTDFIVGHLIASRGLALLTFAPGTERYDSARAMPGRVATG